MSEKPVILFESYPDFSGSPLEIYNELVKRGYDKKYDLIWAVYSTFNEKTNYKIVKFHGCNTPEKQNVLKRTKIIIDSNRYIYKPRSDVFRLFVRHGGTFKNCKNYNSSIGDVDAILTTSDELLHIEQNYFPKSIANKFIVTGIPGTDKLFHPTSLYNGFLQELCDNTKYDKIISWLPTYRQHRFNPSVSAGKKYKFGVPTIEDKTDFVKINAELIKYNCLLLIQMHHAQAKNYENLPACSNIKFVNEAIKNKYNIVTGDILGNSDALITDYSAAYNEFLLLNRPIALTVDDLVKYSKDVGFCFNYVKWVKGDCILDVDDIIYWIDDIAHNIDKNKVSREESLHKFHKFVDDKATDRVIQFLIDKGALCS